MLVVKLMGVTEPESPKVIDGLEFVIQKYLSLQYITMMYDQL